MTDRYFLDINVLVASMTDEPDRGDQATAALNLDSEYLTGLLNLMELRTVLTKKKGLEQSRVESVISEIESRLEVVYHERLTSPPRTSYRRRRSCTRWTVCC